MLEDVIELDLEFGVEDWIFLRTDMGIFEGPDIEGSRLRPFFVGVLFGSSIWV